MMHRFSHVLAWPYLTGLAVLVAVPAVTASFLAFTEFSGLTGPRFNGLDNFRRMFDSGLFRLSLFNSLVYVVVSVPLRIAAAVGLALLLHRRAAGAGAARTSVYLPTVVPDVAYALLWLWILNPLFGPLSAAIGAVGLDPPGWLTEPWAARVSIAFMSVFQIGEGFVVALAARRAIPQQLYESAAVDGASPWFTLRRVTLPVMAPMIVLLLLRDVIVSFQANFVPALIVADGGPRYATTFLPVLVYQTAFRYLRLGYASALTMAMFAITAAIVMVQIAIIRRYRAW